MNVAIAQKSMKGIVALVLMVMLLMSFSHVTAFAASIPGDTNGIYTDSDNNGKDDDSGLTYSAYQTAKGGSASTDEKYNDPNSVSVSMTNGQLTVKGGGFTDGGSASAWESFINKYRNFITGIAGIGAVTMVVLFIIQFLKLGAAAGNPQARSQALSGVLWTGIAAAGLGAVTLIVGFFYNAVG